MVRSVWCALLVACLVGLMATSAQARGGRACRGGGCASCGMGMGGCASCGMGMGGCASCGMGMGPCVGCGMSACPGGCGCGCAACGVVMAPPAPSNRATVEISLPADATVEIGGQATHSTGGQRIYFSPPLSPGVDYYYTLKVRIPRKSGELVVTREVKVTANGTSRLVLTDTDQATKDTASAR